MPARKALWSATLLLVFCLAPSVRALYVRPQLDQVPIERLIRNLTQMADNEPQNVQLRVNLARAHAMAFANGGADVQIRRGQEGAGVWFGFDPAAVPFRGRPGSSPRVGNAGKEHLASAIVAYERALGLDPSDSIARLGYGWCLEQGGDKARAVDAYRRVIAEERQSDLAISRIGSDGSITLPAALGSGNFIEEAVGYLVPLLDPTKDREEIARLRGYVDEQSKKPRGITPIVVPLGDVRDVSRLVDGSARVRFDADGSALDREWTWISKDAGWLVYDQQGTGQISSALQLFGNVTFWMFWENGYEAMRALDDNHDGWLAGAELQHLAIWRDVNGNGVSEAGEVKSLATWGIIELSCAYESEDESDVYIASSKAGVTFSDGSTRPTYDVLLQRR